MITLEEALIMGTNAPWSHQRVITQLIAELYFLYKKQHIITLEPLTEAMLNEDQTSPVPDILLHNHELAETPVIIEITHTKGVRGDLLKIQRLIDEGYYGIDEGFVYDYKRQVWHKIKRGTGIITENTSFCEAINLDLATLL